MMEGKAMQHKQTMLSFAVATGLAFSGSSFSADVVGDNGNNIFFMQGSDQLINRTLTNPYSGDEIEINEIKNTNTASYDGLIGIDTLLMTNQGDAFFLEYPTGTQWIWNVERILAGAGGDILDFSSPTIVLNDLYIVGGASGDILWSNVGNDTVDGQGGDDIIDGGPGNDTLYGGDQNDTIKGGIGDDMIYGEHGANILDGGPDNDSLFSQVYGPPDLVTGGSGIDRFLTALPLNMVSISLSSNPEYELDINSLDPNYPGLFASLRGVEIGVFDAQEVDLSSYLVSQLDCEGFMSPFDKALVLNNKTKKNIPLKVKLYDQDGFIMTDLDIASNPVINVTYSGTVIGTNPPDDEDLLSTGSANEDNILRYSSDTMEWLYNLSTKQFAQAGIYTVTVVSGNNQEYVISNSSPCVQSFTRLP